MDKPKIKIVIVEDHPIFRQGVGDVLSLEDDFEIVGYAESGEEGLQIITQMLPDIALVDVNLPGMNGKELALKVSLAKLKTKLILLTAESNSYQIYHAMHFNV
ncbi:MAG: response regulator, partial [Anaerolineales bacterium]